MQSLRFYYSAIRQLADSFLESILDQEMYSMSNSCICFVAASKAFLRTYLSTREIKNQTRLLNYSLEKFPTLYSILKIFASTVL